MRRYLFYFFYGAFALALQSVWLQGMLYFPFRCDLHFVAIAAVTLSEDSRIGVPLIILLGLLADSVSVQPFGVSIFSYLLVYFLIRLIIGQISYEVGLGRFFWIGAISLFGKAANGFVLSLAQGQPRFFWDFLASQGLQILVDATLGFFLVPWLTKYSTVSMKDVLKPKGLVER
ncbi:MAG: rod shape-determining protein MreD [Deltaproteobacteria bacterium]|nr:rod shape-determining protein MreD [Deltaproteobacteria bacterium]